MDLEFKVFCKYTMMWENDPVAMLAFVDYIDQPVPLEEWWADYQGDYI